MTKQYLALLIIFLLGAIAWHSSAWAEDMDGWSFTDTTGKDEPTPDDAPAERKRYPVRDIEWASVAVGSGSFVLNFRGAAPTFVWDKFYWTTLSADFFAFQARKLADGYRSGMGFLIGQSYGYPWRIDPKSNHELRIGGELGLYAAASFPILASRESPPDAQESSILGWGGLGMGPELTYFYHIRKHLSLTIGMRCIFAVAGKGDYYPFPYLAGQVGLAF